MNPRPFGLGAKPRTKKKTDYKASSFKRIGASGAPETLTPVPCIYMQNQEPSCFTANTLIQLACGKLKPIKEISVGDEILDAYGNKQTVLKKFNRNWQGNLFEIYPYGSGFPIESTPDHPILTTDGFVNAKNITSKHKVIIPVNREIKDKTDFWYETDDGFLEILGLYIAEGHADKRTTGSGRVTFTLNIKEESIAINILSTIKRIFDIDGKITKKQKSHTLSIEFGNKNLAEIFINLGGKGALNKRVHSKFSLLNPEKQLHILRGWLIGDGSIKKHRNVYGKSISKELILDMYLICLRNYIVPSFCINKAYGIHKLSYTLHFSGAFCNIVFSELKYSPNKNDPWLGNFDERGNLIRRVRKVIKLIPANGQNVEKKTFNTNKATWGVYNLNVTGSHTYTANFVGVHNCGEDSATQVRNILLGIVGSPEFGWKTLRKIDGLAPTDGSTSEGVGTQATTIGVCDLTLMNDDSTVPPAQYADYSTVTQAMLDNAAPRKMEKYAFEEAPFTIASIQALVALHGAILLRVNCGTGWWTPSWNAADILPLKLGVYDDDHFICVTDPARSQVPIPNINPNYIYFPNSWSTAWGYNGWGWFDETYLPFVLEALILVPPPTPVNPNPPQYHFTTTPSFMQTSPDVRELQILLGMSTVTGYFGGLTLVAVVNFQWQHGLPISLTVNNQMLQLLGANIA